MSEDGTVYDSMTRAELMVQWTNLAEFLGQVPDGPHVSTWTDNQLRQFLKTTIPAIADLVATEFSDDADAYQFDAVATADDG